MSRIVYTPPPTCGNFMNSASFGRLIAGPVGSGKTTSCLFELFRRAAEQEPAQDGYRYTRMAIVRQTLKQLEDTVLKDIMTWLKGIVTYKVSNRTVYIEVGSIRSEWLLLPMDDPEDQRRLLSMQLTGCWMSECIEMSVNLVGAISGRVGRYPSGPTGSCTWHGIIADTNMPSEGSEWHDFMDNALPNWQIFIQPGGLDPAAENLQWLLQTKETLALAEDDPVRLAQGRKYYENLATNKNPDWIKRYVHAQYGNDPSGSAVFRDTFLPNWHVFRKTPVSNGFGALPDQFTPGLSPVGHAPLIVGMDFGRDPCAVITQVDGFGRLVVLGECVVEDMSLENALIRNLKPMLMHPRYLGKPIVVFGDPAGVAKDSLYDITSYDMLKAHGFMAMPAPTNDIDARIQAVDAFLLQQRQGGPAFMIDGDHCPVLTRALQGGYRYGKTKAGQRKPTPDKNEFSHVMDALQYAALAAHGGMSGVIARKLLTPKRKKTPNFTSAAWT